MARHPSTYYIKYLISLGTPESQKNDWIRWSVESFGFPKLKDAQLVPLREEVTNNLPDPFTPADRFHRPSTRFLRDQKIWSMWHRDEGTELAIQLLTDLKVRDTVEKLLLGRLDYIEIVKKVNSRFSRFYTVNAIQTYEHYFWNVAELAVSDWSEAFEVLDPRREQALAVLGVGASMALRMTGFNQHLEAKLMLREMMQTLYFDFRRWESQPLSVDRTEAMTKLAKTAVSLDSAIASSDAAIKDALKSFEMFRMKNAAEKVTGIGELAPDGNFTGSGARLLEMPKEKVS